MYNNSLSIKLYVKQINKQVKKRFAVTVKEEKIMLPSGMEKRFSWNNGQDRPFFYGSFSLNISSLKLFFIFFLFFRGWTMQRESIYDRMTNAEKEVSNLLKEFGIQ